MKVKHERRWKEIARERGRKRRIERKGLRDRGRKG
jgi:hypothetical protein